MIKIFLTTKKIKTVITYAKYGNKVAITIFYITSSA